MHPISEILCQVYGVLFKHGQVKFGLSEQNKKNIDAVVKTVNSDYFGHERFPTKEDKAVAYLCFLIKDHPVTDGNKRMSIFWFEVFCEMENLKPTEPSLGYDVLAVAIEASSSDEMESLLGTVHKILF
jgi:prophage maintenance system killer protein